MHPRSQAFVRLSCLLLGCGLTCGLHAAEPPKTGVATDDIDTPAYWLPAQRELARLADGVLVWESRRTGTWRIWTMRLDGTHLRQLTTDESGRDHYCPKLSPDGRKLVYLSLSEDWRRRTISIGRGMFPASCT